MNVVKETTENGRFVADGKFSIIIMMIVIFIGKPQNVMAGIINHPPNNNF